MTHKSISRALKSQMISIWKQRQICIKDTRGSQMQLRKVKIVMMSWSEEAYSKNMTTPTKEKLPNRSKSRTCINRSKASRRNNFRSSTMISLVKANSQRGHQNSPPKFPKEAQLPKAKEVMQYSNQTNSMKSSKQLPPQAVSKRH